MMEEKIYEQCNHRWEKIKEYREYIGKSGDFLNGISEHYKVDKIGYFKGKAISKMSKSELLEFAEWASKEIYELEKNQNRVGFKITRRHNLKRIY